MAWQVTQRLRFLRSKLLDDLAAGEKVFVYKNMKRNLTDVELARLYAACRRYGDTTLLYIRYANQDNPNQTVVAAGPGLLVAFIDHFSHAPETDEFLGVAHDDLLAICRTAYAVSLHGRLAQPASTLATRDGPEIPPDETDEAAVRKRIAAARLVRDAGDLAQAMDILARARAELGWHPDLAIESGWAAQIAGRLQEAAEWWTVVRENTPHHVVGYVNGAQVAVGLEQPDEAERLLALGAERLPGRPDLLAEHAALATSRQDWPEASRRSLLVIDLDPDQWPAWLSAARALRHQSLFDDADALLDRAAQRFAPDQDLLTERCWVAHVGGDWPEADRRWAALRELSPAAPDGWVNGARALRELGRYDDAEDLLLHAAATNLDGQSAHWELAWLATLRGDWPVAAARWRVVRSADPGNVVAWHREATALAAMGDTSAASALSHQALSRFPGAVADAPDLARLAGLDREPI